MSTETPDSVCDEMTHDSRGTETFCHLHLNHEDDHDNGLGLTWPRHENEAVQVQVGDGMSTETPETPVASTPPTPENVAEMLTSGDNDYHDGNYWHPSIGADGNVVHIGITAYSEDGDKLPEVHFRAVVVEGEKVPIVLERPASLEQDWTGHTPGLKSWVSPSFFVAVQTPPSVAFMTPAEARREAARLAALADEAEKRAGEEIAARRTEAAQAEQERQS